jgi:CheY-like chemotaxis protein
MSLRARELHPQLGGIPVTILLVEDDPAALSLLAKFFGRLENDIRVMTADTGVSGLGILRLQLVDILVADLQKPGLDGFELLAVATRELPEIPVVVVTALDARMTARLSRIGHFRVLRKPVGLEELRAAAEEEMVAARHGALSGFTLSSFLQLVEMERKTCSVRVAAQGKVGYFHFESGELLDAVTEDKRGEAAACETIVWEKPEIRILPLLRRPERTIGRSLTNLALDAFRLHDEGRRLPDDPSAQPSAANPVDTDRVYSASPERFRQSGVGSLPPQATELLFFLDGVTPFREVLQLFPGREEESIRLISRLLELGLVI